MATVQASNITKVNGANTYVLGDVSPSGVGAFSIHFDNDGTFVGSITIKARSRIAASSTSYQATVYGGLFLNGTGSDGTVVTTAITDTSIVMVPASGLQIALVVTAYTSGSGTLYVVPVTGASVI